MIYIAPISLKESGRQIQDGGRPPLKS